MFTQGSFRKPKKLELELIQKFRKRWNPTCERKNINQIRIVHEHQGNFTACVILYPSKGKTTYFAGFSKRNPGADDDNIEIGETIALARACKDLFSRLVSPPKKKDASLVVAEIKELWRVADKEIDEVIDEVEESEEEREALELKASHYVLKSNDIPEEHHEHVV